MLFIEVHIVDIIQTSWQKLVLLVLFNFIVHIYIVHKIPTEL